MVGVVGGRAYSDRLELLLEAPLLQVHGLSHLHPGHRVEVAKAGADLFRCARSPDRLSRLVRCKDDVRIRPTPRTPELRVHITLAPITWAEAMEDETERR